MELDEIVLPETKPETEWVRGRALQKLSPMRDHALIQGEFIARLKPWARGRGEVGPEWRFRIAVPGELRRPFVPDVSYVAAELLRGGSLVLVVDTRKRTVLVCDAERRIALCEDDTLSHPALPDFTLPLREFFATALDETF